MHDDSKGFAGRLVAAAVLLAGLLAGGSAEAYVGPGAGLTAIGSVLALGAAVVLGIVGFVWYPIKRMLRRNKKPQAATTAKQ